MIAFAAHRRENPMLVTFTTESYADITLFKDVALQLLTLMGHSSTVPGVIMAEDVPTALQQLKSAMATEQVPITASNDGEDDERPDVSLRNRALPLLELLASASAEDANVMWEWT